jgi:hypothetical protein
MSDAPKTDSAPGKPEPPRPAKRPLSYVLSLPERALRSGTGLVGGVVRESASLLVPRAFQSSKLYTVMVRQMLDFLVHDVGGVDQKEAPSSTAEVDNYVARKAVGNFVDLASMATLHLSPVLILAAVSDLAYGSQVYLKELAKELEEQGVVKDASRIHHVNDLLTAVSDTSAATSQVFNTPPLSVEALKKTLDDTKAAVRAGTSAVPSAAEVERLWRQMREISLAEKVGLLAVSTAATMRSLDKFATLGRGALSTVKVAGNLFDEHVLDHYSNALTEIRAKGVYASLAQTSGPYIAAVWKNFQPTKSTLTEDLVSGKLLGSTWRAVRKWVGSDETRDNQQPDTVHRAQPVQPAKGQSP